ncbi:MAG: PEP/pyruvate-binding domain-containing protein [Armatimonadota bacterium]
MHILWPDDPEAPAQQFGGKAGALRRLVDLPIPPFFAVAPQAWVASRAADIRFTLASETVPSDEVAAEVNVALARLDPSPQARFAVRSSAVDEDGAGHSFAGQLESYLNVKPEEVVARIADVWKSGFSTRVRAYRVERGLDPEPLPPSVLVQRMVPADASGVAFSADPVTGRRGVAVVAAVPGLGTALVGGDVDADTWEVDRDGTVVGAHVAVKTHAHRPGPDGVVEVDIAPERSTDPVLGESEARAIARLAREAERLAGCPQDIEWAMEGGTLFLLQSRPITTLHRMPDPDGARVIFDNSNIAESYNGVTTALTFSFARTAYEHVYRAFCRILSVPDERIAGRDLAFRNLLGMVDGRVYYNLPNWYRLLALLPGYRLNQTFMEQMMGVREPLPADAVPDLQAPADARERRRDALALARSVLRLVRHHRRLPRTIGEFNQRLESALSVPSERLSSMRADELAAHYHDLEHRLLARWDAPLVNDFLAMCFHGVLRRLTERWVAGAGDDAEGLHNDLITGQGGIVSAEPAHRVAEMASMVVGDSAGIEVLTTRHPATARRWLADHRPELASRIEDYMDRFGDRCLEELKLESATLEDDPTPLVRAIGSLGRRGETPDRRPAPHESPRAVAERRVRKALSPNPLRHAMYRWVLANARERVRDRENLRFERTRVFGRVRRIFVEIGKRFAADGLLDDPKDIFHLDIGEILGAIEGTATCTDLRGLAKVRREAVERWKAAPEPGERIESRGIVAVATNRWATEPPVSHTDLESDADQRRGLACCPGRVEGIARVITDPRGATLEAGAILVAERTDPGWILLFPAAAGVLVERGSLLSHSAIVARELGIPCIVSVPGATRWLRDGDRVAMDGATGVVHRVAPVPSPPAEPTEDSKPQGSSDPAAADEPPAGDIAGAVAEEPS